MAKRHEEWWARYLRQPSEQRSIAPVLGLTLLAMLSIPVLTDHTWGRSVEVGLVGLSAIVALNRTGAHGGLRRAAVGVVLLTTTIAAVAPQISRLQDGPVTELAAALFILLLVITPIVILLRLLLRPKITVDTLAGCLAAYLQIGIFFGALFSFVQLVSNTPFFAEKVPPGTMSFQYFSFITMTTVGYGDLTPATPWGQTLATMEAVVGQVFLVTVVALTVSNLGRSLSHRQGLADGAVDGGASPEIGALDPQADAR